MQRSEALRVSEHAIDESKRAIDGLPDDLGRRYDAGQARLQALAFVQQDHAPVEARVLAHGAQPLAQGEQFADLLGVPFLESGQGPVEHDRVAERADREAVLPVPHAEAAILGLVGELQLTLFERCAIAVAEERNNELAIRPEAVPVDIEGPFEGRGLAPFENREPPRIVRPADTHVVRHDVENEAEAVLPQGVRSSAGSRPRLRAPG